MRATYGSASVASLTRIFWMSRSRRRRTVGYETPYSEAISLSDPDARTNRLMNETSSSSRSAIQGGGNDLDAHGTTLPSKRLKQFLPLFFKYKTREIPGRRRRWRARSGTRRRLCGQRCLVLSLEGGSRKQVDRGGSAGQSSCRPCRREACGPISCASCRSGSRHEQLQGTEAPGFPCVRTMARGASLRMASAGAVFAIVVSTLCRSNWQENRDLRGVS